MCSARDNVALPTLGFPIRASAGHWPFSASPRLIAVVHALLRLLVPRHPPCALTILTVIKSGAVCGPAYASAQSARDKDGRKASALGCVSLALAMRFSRAAESRGRGLRPCAVSQN